MNDTATIFREGMSRLGAAVNLVTTDGPEGRHGMTASAVCSITDQPPTLLVCVNRQNRSHDRFNANGKLCVNVLAGRHEALATAFASRGSEDRFSGDTWIRLATGAPVLESAVVAFDCRIVERKVIGTHSVFYAQVEATRLGAEPAEALVWFDRRFHPLTARMPEKV
ncbi:flavin reductase [Martelella radicis]|uniref:Flavin reductase n=1 Tax=Martelella radicis TaxID=1397476 RepID=A0A7W6KK29_9HYPH|nr:flavin reductase [Martelella radicis]MBB4122475.1 flavin reductase [Martelella radicis]